MSKVTLKLVSTYVAPYPPALFYGSSSQSAAAKNPFWYSKHEPFRYKSAAQEKRLQMPRLKSCCRDVGLRLSIVPRRRHQLVKHGMSITEQVIKSRGSLLQRTTRHNSGFNQQPRNALDSLGFPFLSGRGGGGGGGGIRPITADVKSILLVDVACERPTT